MLTGIKSNLIIIAICFLFFFLYSLLNLSSPNKFTSPDESVNLFFTQYYAEKGDLRFYESLNSITDGYAHPRNAVSINDMVSPTGFPGFYIVYGTVGSMIPGIIPYITPLLAIVGGLFIYLITSTIYDKRTALVALILVFILPPYWYWSSMSLFNNMPATIFLVGGITFLIMSIKFKQIGYYIATGLCFGLNHFFRTTDITYLIPLSFLIYSFRNRIIWKYLLISSIFYLVTIIPLFITNKMLYGSMLAFGYSAGPKVAQKTSAIISLFERVKFFLLPSGLNLDKILFSFSTYLLQLTPIIITLGIIGIFKWKELNDEITKKYIIFYFLLFAWILAYYGSGYFWGLTGFTLDASYIRYFLPIYILIIPLVAKLITQIPKRLALIVIPALVISSIIGTYQLNSGLIDMNLRRLNAHKDSKTISRITESNSILITTLADKYIFPERKVVTYGPVFKEFNYEKLALYSSNLHKTNLPIYILNDRNDIDIETINKLLRKNNLSYVKSDKFINIFKLKRV